MTRVLVTGAFGYIGARLSKHLVEKGYSITVLVRRHRKSEGDWLGSLEDEIIGDIRDEATLARAAKREFDAAIHLVSLDHHRSDAEPSEVASVNVVPTWNLLWHLTRRGLGRFIYLSTVQVYGELPPQLVTEEFKQAPTNAYGLTHLLSEDICNFYHRKTDTACINLRLSNSYGEPVFPDCDCWSLVVNDLCRMAFADGRIRLRSDGSPQRDFIHYSDVCRAVEQMVSVRTAEVAHNTCHVASGRSLTMLELAHMIREVFDRRYRRAIDVSVANSDAGVAGNPYVDRRFALDNGRMRGYGWRVTTDLEAGVEALFEYLEQAL